jgi:hypothetical protein
VHFHALFADGVFYKTENGNYKFLRLVEPGQEELRVLATKIRDKVNKLAQKLYCSSEEQSGFDESVLSDVAALSIC